MLIGLRRAGLLSVALLSLVSTACNTDTVAAPTLTAPSVVVPAPSMLPPDGASQDLLGGLLGTVTGTVGAVTNTLGLTSANGVLRTRPLAQAITVRKTIGRSGGSLGIPEAGVTVIVPYGALDRDTEITMTARAGYLLAYDFEPHGVTFKVPLVFNQSLKNTNVGLLSPLALKLGYYEDPSLLGKTTALVSEVVGGLTSILTRTFTAPIKHFSGYLVICGRSDE
jgi:ZU5 domain